MIPSQTASSSTMSCERARVVSAGEPDGSAPGAPLTIAIVSYNVAPLLDACLRSVQAAAGELGEPAAAIVVDNASRDGSAALVRERFPWVQVIENAQNRGFGAACNQALALAGELLLLLNPDTILEPGALPALVARLRATPRAAIVGPRLRFPDGRPQPVRRRFPALSTLLVESTPLEWRLGFGRLMAHYRCADLPEAAMPVDWLSGACLLARAAALREVGGFDPVFFLYFEETDLCRRLAARGWQVWYEPAALVTHHHSQSAGQDLMARDRAYNASKQRYLARYWGPTVGRVVAGMHALLFAIEAALQYRRGDRVQGRRYAVLARALLAGA